MRKFSQYLWNVIISKFRLHVFENLGTRIMNPIYQYGLNIQGVVSSAYILTFSISINANIFWACNKQQRQSEYFLQVREH